MESATDRKPSSVWMRIIHSIRGRFLAGLLVVAPLWLTYIALKFFFHLLDSFFAPLVRQWVGVSIPGLGFILLFIEDQRTARPFAMVFIPTTPNPTTGVFEMVPRADIIETNLTVEEGIKMVLSGGLVAPASFTTLAEGATPSSQP